MSRKAIISIMAILGTGLFCGAANAATTKFCFRWEGDYDDAGFGEDYLDTDGLNTVPAAYTLVSMRQINPWSPYTFNYWLDEDGCTPSVTAYAGRTYRFWQYTRANRSGRDIYAIPDGQEFESTVVSYDTWDVTPFSVPNPYPTFSAPSHSTNNEFQMMPALVQILKRSAAMDWWTTSDVWVSTDSALGCGSFCSQGSQSNRFNVCIGDTRVDEKFLIGHEIGHSVARRADGPRPGSYQGTEGMFRADGVGNRCDCTEISEFHPHCLGSREFTGTAQGEGFPHFLSTIAFNARSTGSSFFAYYKDVMEPSTAHYNAMPSLLPNPTSDRNNTEPAPYPLQVDDDAFVQWTDYECDPTGDDFEHYGTEWDWLLFFWNLYTHGGNGVKYDVDEINDIWDDVSDSDIAYVCCSAYDDNPDPDKEYWIPVVCAPKDDSAACGTYPNPPGLTHSFTVGKLWEADSSFDVSVGVRNQAYQTYHSSNPDKYDHFADTGDDAGVTY